MKIRYSKAVAMEEITLKKNLPKPLHKAPHLVKRLYTTGLVSFLPC